MPDVVPMERIVGKIYIIRETKVMRDRDLAELYDVKTKVLKQAVRKNRSRFPDDFMFELTKEEFANLRSQFVTSSSLQMNAPIQDPSAGTVAASLAAFCQADLPAGF